MAWRVAKSLDLLLLQLDTLFPNRKKASDGSIGDAAHAGRASDHNPVNGVVHARDFTHDRETGVNGHALAYALQKSRDPRLKYVIWNKKIMGGNAGPAPWKWRDYSGSNPHQKHLHLSVVGNALADNDTLWDIGGLEWPGSLKDTTSPGGFEDQTPMIREIDEPGHIEEPSD